MTSGEPDPSLPTPDFYRYRWEPLAAVEAAGAGASMGTNAGAATYAGWDELNVSWADGTELRIKHCWLQENAPGRSVDPVTCEGLLDPAELVTSGSIVSASVAADGALRVDWFDRGDPSLIHPGWLRHWAQPDGVATTGEIDDAIRYGFGLRWAQMGLFETYRVAGGEGGMAHFIAQFGETLNWPWTKLMDTPELTPELVAEIGEQSDAQSGHLSIAQLEDARDQNLVAILEALAGNQWGAGQVLNRARRERHRGLGAPGSEGVRSQPAASPPVDRSERP